MKQSFECLNYSNHKFFLPDEKIGALTSPYHGQKTGDAFNTSQKNIHEILERAETAYHKWKNDSYRDRQKVFYKFALWLETNKEIIAEVIMHECGKLKNEAKDELSKAIEVTEFAMSMVEHDTMEKQLVSAGIHCEFRREPLGVVVGITPSNFPAMVAMWMLPIALMSGNAFVWKPSEKTPFTPTLLAKGLEECGLPEGLLSIIHGNRNVVEQLCVHPIVKAVGFVGSTPAAKHVYQLATSAFKKALTLGGAKNHIILMPDAPANMTTDAIIAAFSGCAGQRCMAASNLLVVGKCDQLLEEIFEKSKNFTAGKNIGAIITKESLTRICSAIEKNIHEKNCQLKIDGREITTPQEYKNGNWLGPTILDHVNPNSTLACEELFGPVLSVIRCQNLTEALSIENKNNYGNAASIFTTHGAAAEYFASNARAGMIGINIGIPVPREPFSFGGFYDSKFGNGDITGKLGIEFWTQKKKITTKWFVQNQTNWMS